MYLKTVLDAQKLSSGIVEYLSIVGAGFKYFSPDLIRIGYFYESGIKIDPNDFHDIDEDIVIRIYYQSLSSDCYLSMKKLIIDDIPFGDLMYQFASMMMAIEMIDSIK